MRLHGQGLHQRPRRASARSLIVTLIAALAAFLAVAGLAGTFAGASVTVPSRATANRETANPVTAMGYSQVKAGIAQVRMLAAAQAAVRAAAVLAAHTYTVRPGDSLSAVAARHCGQAKYWTGIYAASRDRRWTARNANQLSTGQHLYLSCAYLPSMLRFAPAPPPPPVIRTVAAVTSGRTASTGRTSRARSTASSSYQAPAQVPASAGTYSYAGLEALWESAGGPSWAAPHAAEIAECESGGRVSAYNPSGATGLWQILGSVVPGNLYNAYTNALNAVSKFRASGSTFAQWVCR